MSPPKKPDWLKYVKPSTPHHTGPAARLLPKDYLVEIAPGVKVNIEMARKKFLDDELVKLMEYLPDSKDRKNSIATVNKKADEIKLAFNEYVKSTSSG